MSLDPHVWRPYRHTGHGRPYHLGGGRFGCGRRHLYIIFNIIYIMRIIYDPDFLGNGPIAETTSCMNAPDRTSRKIAGYGH